MRRLTLIFGFALAIGLMACQQNSAQPEPEMQNVSTVSPYFKSNDAIMPTSGVQIRYRHLGAADAPAIIMLHGFSFSLESWDALASQLKDDYQIFSLDLPGHGLTGPDPQARYSNTQTTERLAQFIDALGLKDVILVGNSLGGLVAWQYGAAHPDNTKALILLAPGGFPINGVGDEPAPVPAMMKTYLKHAPEAAVRGGLQTLYSDPAKVTDAQVTRVRDMIVQPGNSDALIARLEQFTLPDPTQALASIKAPTLILWGDQDKMVAPAQADMFKAAISGAELKTYPDAGHIPQEEIPDTVAGDIRAFLKKVAP